MKIALLGGAGLALGRRVTALPFNESLVLDKTCNVAIPRGCQLRLVAESSKQVLAISSYRWHGAPDGGACFPDADAGWIYVSNSELPNNQGGVGAIRFNAEGEIVDAYPILAGKQHASGRKWVHLITRPSRSIRCHPSAT